MSHAPRPRGPTYGFLAQRAAEELEDDEQLDLMSPDYRARARQYVEDRERARVRENWEPMFESWMVEVERETSAAEARGERPRHAPALSSAVVPLTPEMIAKARHYLGRKFAA